MRSCRERETVQTGGSAFPRVVGGRGLGLLSLNTRAGIVVLEEKSRQGGSYLLHPGLPIRGTSRVRQLGALSGCVASNVFIGDRYL